MEMADCLVFLVNVQGFFGVYDGHGGKKAAEFVAENLHTNILQMMENCEEPMSKEEAVKAGYLKTDQEFLKQVIAIWISSVSKMLVFLDS